LKDESFQMYYLEYIAAERERRRRTVSQSVPSSAVQAQAGEEGALPQLALLRAPHYSLAGAAGKARSSRGRT